MIDIKSMDIEELEQFMVSLGEKKFHAVQLYKWMHQKLAASFSECSDLSKDLKQKLSEQCTMITLKPIKVLKSTIDGTEKYLFKLYDDHVIESVLMRYHHGNSVCISSQVGCRMGCRFCASTIDGCVRNLSASEMLDQIYRIQQLSGERVDNIVVMGSGEPLDNYDNLIRFLKLINHEKGLHISTRNITVSTCGLVPKIYELADEQMPITLAISLHAPNDVLRKTMMPIANKYSIEEIMKACHHYIQVTNRRITFEYSLVKGVNDTNKCADELIQRLRGMNCHVNLIPVNPIKENDYKQSDKRAVEAFKKRLEYGRINVTVRRALGRDINGSCGQLRRSYMSEKAVTV